MSKRLWTDIVARVSADPRQIAGLKGLSALCLVAFLALVAAPPAPAAAAEYSLTPAGCFEDQGSAATCAQSVPYLADPTAVAVSPDGASVYVASATDNVIAIFRRAADGSLIPEGCIGDITTTICGTGADDRGPGLAGVADLTVSQDGRHVFAVSPIDDTLVGLHRDTETGELTWNGCFEAPPDDGLCPGGASAGLDGARTVLSVDPPGANAFVFVGASGADDTLMRWAYESHGILFTFTPCVFSDPDNQLSGCPPAEGLGGITDLAATENREGESLYAVSKGDDAIARFNVKGFADNSFAGCIRDAESGDSGCTATAPGLDDPRGVEVSPDGDQVYVAALGSSALIEFNRAHPGLTGTPDGALTPIGCVNDAGTGAGCAASAEGLDAVFAVAASPDGESVYSASIGDGALASFARPSPTGLLAPAGCLEAAGIGAGCGGTAPGLGVNLGLAVSPDGRSVYVTSSSADTLAVFDRAPVLPPSEPPPAGPPGGGSGGAGEPGSGGAGSGGSGTGSGAATATANPTPHPAPRRARLRILRVKRNPRAGTATLTVAIPTAGVLRLRGGRFLRPSRRRAGAAGRLRIVVRPNQRGRRALRKNHRLRVTARLDLSAPGVTRTTTRRVGLILNPPRR